MYYDAASLLLCTTFTWLCASFGAEQRKVQAGVQRKYLEDIEWLWVII